MNSAHHWRFSCSWHCQSSHICSGKLLFSFQSSLPCQSAENKTKQKLQLCTCFSSLECKCLLWVSPLPSLVRQCNFDNKCYILNTLKLAERIHSSEQAAVHRCCVLEFWACIFQADGQCCPWHGMEIGPNKQLVLSKLIRLAMCHKRHIWLQYDSTWVKTPHKLQILLWDVFSLHKTCMDLQSW